MIRERIARCYRIYQLCIRSDFSLAAHETRAQACDVEFERATSEDKRPFELSDAYVRQGVLASGAILHVCDAQLCIHYPGLVDFYFVDSNRIVCFPVAGAEEATVVALLQGPVCALLLERRGVVCLHASSIQIGGHAVAFLGNSGAGKSSLAAHFMSHGCPLLSDDILPLTLDGETCQAIPGPPMIKLAEVMSQSFRFPGEFDPSTQKVVSQIAPGSNLWMNQPVPLRVAYLLCREPRLSSAITIEDVAPTERFAELLRFSFCAGAFAMLGMETSRFFPLGRIAEAVAMRRLRYANGLENLELVRKAVI